MHDDALYTLHTETDHPSAIVIITTTRDHAHLQQRCRFSSAFRAPPSGGIDALLETLSSEGEKRYQVLVESMPVNPALHKVIALVTRYLQTQR